MKSLRIHTLALSMLALTGCGGGGGDTTTAPPPPPPSVTGYPASGAYGWTLKASGPTSALKYGLSFAHTGMPENEYVVETATQSITDTRLLSRGTVNTAQATVSNIQPHALVYIYGGDVRTVSMQANGQSPHLSMKRTFTTTACRFVIAAPHFDAPDNSRFIVSTAGNDPVCGNAGDGLAEVRLSATGDPVLTLLTGDAPLDVSRDPQTLAPRGWIYPRHIQLWEAGTIALRPAGQAALTSVVGVTPQDALVSDGTRLSMLRFGAGNAVTETALNAATTAGAYWRLIGYDADSYYVYDDNPSHVHTSPWRVLRITRTATPQVSEVGSGTGYISVASMGSGVLYLTVFGAANNHLLRLPKAGGSPVVDTFPLAENRTVQTSAAGRHLQWVVTGIGTSPVHTVNIVDENGTLLSTAAGGVPINSVEASQQSFNVSENRTRFLYVQGFGTRAYANTTLISYDATTGTPTTLGTLPGTADYGDAFVFAFAGGGPTSVGVGFATRSITRSVTSSEYSEQDAKVFSYDLGTAASLRTATHR